MQILVDADACPKVIKEILFRVADRLKIQTTLVANQMLYCPPSKYIRAMQVPAGFDVADNKIAVMVESGGSPELGQKDRQAFASQLGRFMSKYAKSKGADMQVEIWSDVICPWCYIGKRRFEMALADFAQRGDVELIWRSFELDAQAPRQHPVTLNELLARKYRVSLQEAAAMNGRVSGVAAEIGLEYHLENARPGNTFDAHRLLHFAAAKQVGDRATEHVMHAYFCEAFPVGDRTALARLAPEFGISEDDALAMLESNAYVDAVRADEARAAGFGISGVPFFVFDEKFGVSGAQPVEVFAEALQQVGETA